MKNLQKTSKFLSLLLRHRPEKVGLTLDAFGWASVAELLQKTNITQAELDTIVATDNKGRYSYSEDRTKIRANQGHSIRVNLELQPQTPPDTLYHGTVDRFMDSIQAQGLQPRNRHHVHLSADLATARTVGGRRGKPVILRIDAATMHADGHCFYCSENGVWLTDAVPPQYFKREV